MGSAFVSVADDANAVYWNPAGMVQLAPRFELTGCRTMLYAVDALSNDYLAAVYDWDNRIAVGVSWVRLALEDIYSENTINIAVAGKAPFIDGLSVGASLKLFTLDAPGYEQYNDPSYGGSVTEPSFDVGVQYRPAENWSIGAVVYNVNEPELALLSTTTTPDPVYRDYAFGASYLFSDLLLASWDFRTRYGEWENTIGRIGSEIWFFDAVVLRGGFERDNMTAGFGLRNAWWQMDVMLETHDELGNTYQFAATIRH